MQAESAKNNTPHNQQNEIPKDYSLLRKFNFEAAKRGEFLTNIQESFKYILKSCSTKWEGGVENVEYVIQLVDGYDSYEYKVSDLSVLRMLPLCWIEGKPVYKGDVLWRKDKYTDEVIQVTVESFVEQKYTNIGKHAFLNFEGDIDTRLDFAFSTLHWEKPKVKVQKEGWMNIYHAEGIWRSKAVFATKEMADEYATGDRIDCVKVQWEVQE